MTHSTNYEKPASYAHFEKTRREAVRIQRRQGILFGVLFLGALLGSLWIAEVSAEKLAKGIPEIFSYIRRTLPPLQWGSLGQDLGEWYWGLGKWLNLLLDTVLIGFLGSFLGVLGAGVLCFPASRNLMGRYSVYFLFRRTLEIARAVPELVYALVFVFAFGLGPLPGVLAIAIHSAGALGKLFSEVNENIDPSSVEGVRPQGETGSRSSVMPSFRKSFPILQAMRSSVSRSKCGRRRSSALWGPEESGRSFSSSSVSSSIPM